MFLIYLLTKYHLPSLSGALDIAIKMKVEIK
jgi:hypothetical protein